MKEVSYVVVFPTVFSKNKIPQLISNIKKILKIRNQEYTSVKRDGEIILVKSGDPVFASSAISLLFGIEKVAIARQVKNEFKTLVSEISSIGGNLLLKGEKFLVKVEGNTKGFFPKDVEIAATSTIIEKKSKLGAIPGTEGNHDKLLYTYLTKNNAYICIFTDIGNGGIPLTSKQNTICCVFDELSAISCFETIKQGYDTKIIIVYVKKSELLHIAKTINQILPRLVKEKVTLDFFEFKINKKNVMNYSQILNTVIEIMIHETKSKNFKFISLPITPLIFSQKVLESVIKKIIDSKKYPIFPLFGVDQRIFDSAKEIGLENKLVNLKKIVKSEFNEFPKTDKKEIKSTLSSKKTVEITIGPNNVHDILDSLE